MPYWRALLDPVQTEKLNFKFARKVERTNLLAAIQKDGDVEDDVDEESDEDQH